MNHLIDLRPDAHPRTAPLLSRQRSARRQTWQQIRHWTIAVLVLGVIAWWVRGGGS